MSYRKVFINPYPEGWVDLPNEDTSISAAALQAHTDAIEKMDSYLEKIGKAEDAGYIQMNMFNMSTVYLGKKLGDEGELVDDPGSMTTDFIEIDDKLQYMLSALNDSECSVKVHAYNSDFEWMMLCAMQTFYVNVVFPFAVINGAKYIKVSLSKDAKEVVLEDGYITHPYLPSNKELAAELSEQKESLIQFKDDGFLPKNLLNKSTDRIGIGMADNGTENTNGNAEMTEYIEVLPNRTCTISWLRTDTNMATRVALYDESKTFISLPIRDVRTEVSAQRYFATFNTTSNTKYLRANFSKAHKDVQIEYGNEMTEYSIYAIANTGLTQIVGDAIDNGYISKNYISDIQQGTISGGTEASSTTRLRTNYIKYKDGIILTSDKALNVILVSYKADKSFVGQNGWFTLNANEPTKIQSTHSNVEFVRLVIRYPNESNITPADIRIFGTDIPSNTELKQSLSQLMPTGLITTGLSFSGCTYTSGGYCRIGKMVYVDLYLTTTKEFVTLDTCVSGIPSSVKSATNLSVGTYDSNNDVNPLCVVSTSNTIALMRCQKNTGVFISGIYLAN